MADIQRHLTRLAIVLIMLAGLSACGLLYRVPIRQGNVLTPDAVAQLETGMTKKQVRYVMGTPLIKDSFNGNRWDYVFYYRNPSARVRQSSIRLYFSNGELARIKGKQQFLQASHGGRITDADGNPQSASNDHP